MTTEYPRTFPVAGPLSLSARVGAGESSSRPPTSTRPLSTCSQ